MGSMGFTCSFLAILACTVIAGIAAKRAVRQMSDFRNASGKLTSGVVAGALVGGFVGGTSIVGTGELAFQHGLAALWFTLGGGIAVMLLGLLARRLREENVETLPELIGTQYGERAQLGASLFLSWGMFIQVIAQLLAALPFVSVFWKESAPWMALVPALLIVACVLAAGFMGASVVGSMKTVMLAILLLLTGVWLGWQGDGEMYLRWWTEGRLTLFAPEANLGWAQGGAMVVGIFSTQAYLQPIFASQNDAEARTGSLVAGAVIILIGIISAWIGLFMKDAHPSIVAREAIPQFFLRYAPDWISGAACAVILLSVVMTGAALTLSITTILNRDVIQRYSLRFRSATRELAVSRALILLIIAAAYGIVCLDSGALILQWAFLAMTLRGVTVFLPILFYLLRLGPIDSRWAAIAVWGAPMTALAWTWGGMPFTGVDPLYVSGFWSLGALCAGKWTTKTPSLRQMG